MYTEGLPWGLRGAHLVKSHKWYTSERAFRCPGQATLPQPGGVAEVVSSDKHVIDATGIYILPLEERSPGQTKVMVALLSNLVIQRVSF